MSQIRANLKAAKSRQESYANKRHRPLEFGVGNHIYLHVSPMKDVKKFGMKGKLAPHYIGPFPILERCGPVAYKLDLPPSLTNVNDIFHVSQLKKCLKAPSDVVLPEVAPLEADLSYLEHMINGAIIPKKKPLEKVRNPFVLTIWNSCLCNKVCCNYFPISFEPSSLHNLGSRFL
jgi:hypothetical protein